MAAAAQPLTLRELHESEETIALLCEQIRDARDAADDREHRERIESMTPAQVRRESGLSEADIERFGRWMSGLVASADDCAGCGVESRVPTSRACIGCFFTDGESAVAGEG